jgi:hypothetical protein
MWQEGILLRARETVQLIDKEERLLAVFTAFDRCGHRLADLGHTVTRCGEARWDRLQGRGDDGSECRFTTPRWPPEQE